jgi:hypothetical protein
MTSLQVTFKSGRIMCTTFKNGKSGAISLVLFLLLILLAPADFVSWAASAQDTLSRQGAVTREEVLTRLKQGQSNPRQSGQGDLAEMIVERGVDFSVDEAVIDEFRRAGARSFLIDAIRVAGRAGNRQAPASDPERPRLRGAEEPLLQPSPETNPDNISEKRPEKRSEKSLEDLTPEEREAALASLPFIEQARYHALEYSDDLPNFRVTQLVTRYFRGLASKDWEKRDSLELELSYSARDGEKYRLVKLDGAPTKMSYDQVGGSTSTGEFGALMSSLFSPQAKTDFRETGREALNGRQTAIYDFRVKKVNSNSELSDRQTGRTVIAGYQGTVWIDLESKRVLRIELAHENIPASFPLTLAENSVDYDWVTIAGERYLLPVRAEVLLGRERERQYSRNLIEFRHYQKFDTDVKLVPDNN